MDIPDQLRSGLLTVVLPAYNEEESVPLAAETIGSLLTQAGIRHELLFVNDGSRDHTWRAIQEAAARRSSSLKSEARDISIWVAPLKKR